MQLTQQAPSPLPVRSEAALVDAARRGDDRAFEHLYASYRDQIHAFILSKVRDHGRAEDLGQEVFMSALRQLRGCDQMIHFKPWLYTIAKNACIDEYRRGARTREVPIESEDALAPGAVSSERLLSALPTPVSAIESKQSLDDLRGAFGGLSDSQHRLLVLREFEGLSYEEIGEQLGMTKQMVESGLFRARRKLSEEYDELASGRRCGQVQSAIDGGRLQSARGLGVKERRRYSRHLSHCQPCRHVAMMSGVDGALLRPRSIVDKVAALLPFGLLRRLWPFGGRGRAAAGAAGHHAAAGGAAAGAAAGSAGAGIGSGPAAAVAVLALAGAGGGLAVATHHGAHPRIAPAIHAGQHAAARRESLGTGAAVRLGTTAAGTRSVGARSSGGSGSVRGAAGVSDAHPGATLAGRRAFGAGGTTASASGAPGHAAPTTSPGSTSTTSGANPAGAGSTGGRPSASPAKTSASGVASAANGAKTTVATTAPGPGSTVNSVTSGVNTTVNSVTSGVGTTVTNTASGVGTGVGATASGAGTTVTKTASGVGTTVTTTTSGLGTTVNTIVPGAGTVVTNAGSAAGSTVSSVGSTAGSTVTATGSTLGTTVAGVGATVGKIVSGLG